MYKSNQSSQPHTGPSSAFNPPKASLSVNSYPPRPDQTRRKSKEVMRSYGVIVMNPAGEILMVQHDYSYALGGLIAGGKYCPSDCLGPAYVQSLCPEEHTKILLGISTGKHVFFNKCIDECYREKLQAMSDSEKVSFRQRKFERYTTALEILGDSLRNEKARGFFPWGFPKGRLDLNATCNAATCKAAAYRELLEETSVHADALTPHDDVGTYVFSYTDYDGITYETELWFATAPANLQYKLSDKEIRNISFWSASKLGLQDLCYVTRTHILAEIPKLLAYFREQKALIATSQSLGNRAFGVTSGPVTHYSSNWHSGASALTKPHAQITNFLNARMSPSDSDDWKNTCKCKAARKDRCKCLSN